MQALHWDGQDIHIERAYPQPVIEANMAVVRVRLAGICATDLQIFQGYMDFRGVPGHEWVGEVCEGPEELLGTRVVGEINFACGRCATCAQGLARHCPTRRVMGILNADGCFAEYMAVPVANLHHVPDIMTDEEAVFTEPLAAAWEIGEQIHVQPGTEVLVLGDGKLGLLCAQVLQSLGACVWVVGKHAAKLDLLRPLGMSTSLLADWQPRPFPVVVEATGSASGLAMALEAVRPRGTLVLKSTLAARHSLSLAPLVVNEVTVVGSRCGRFPPALQALEQRRVQVTPLLETTYPLAAGREAIAHAARAGARKILLRLA